MSSPALNPGDLVFVEVWNTSPTQGYAYFYNYTTDESAEYTITAPSGTALQDASVEWIVERPEGDGVLTPLTNYVDVPWAEGVAWNYAAIRPTTYLLDQSPSNATLENFTMLDDDGNPISAAIIENDTFRGSKIRDHPAAATAPRPAEELNQSRHRARARTRGSLPIYFRSSIERTILEARP